MPKPKTTPFREVLKEALKDPATKREYDKLKPWYEKQLRKIEAKEALKKFTDEIVALRKARGLTQAELGKRIGTSQPAIARLESGNYTSFSFPLIRKIALALDAVPELHLRAQ